MLRATLLMFLAMSLIPAGDTAGKLLSNNYQVHPLWIAWSRFALGALIAAPFMPRGTWGVLRNPKVVFRALLLAGGISCILTALRTEDIANVFAAFFIGPLLSFTLSAWLLKEKVTWVQTALLLLGFCGVLLVVKPGFDYSPGLGFAVLAGCFYGSFLTASKWLIGVAPARTLLLSQLLIPAIIMLPVAAVFWPPLSLPVLGLATASAVGSMSGNFLLLFAYAMADSTRLAPLVYFQLIAATVLGWTVFGTLPDTLTLCGLVLIIGAGVGAATLRR